MRYSYEYKLECIELYRKGIWPETPEGKNKMDATCNVQDSIHVFHLVHNMCPGFWVHINFFNQYFECVLFF